MSEPTYYEHPYTVWQPGPSQPAARPVVAATEALPEGVLWQAPKSPEICAPPANVPENGGGPAGGRVTKTDAAIRRFRCVLSDPPWRYRNYSKKGEWKNATRHYDCLTVNQIAELPVKDVLTDDAVLFMWVTGPFLLNEDLEKSLANPIDLAPAAKIALSWGFTTYSGLAFLWAKRSPSGKSWHFGPGYWTRHNAELVLIFTRKKKPERLDRGVAELVISPRREHSRKPDEVHERIERLIDGPRLELFAREPREGWTTLGNHLTGNDIADDLRALASQPSLSFAAPPPPTDPKGAPCGE